MLPPIYLGYRYSLGTDSFRHDDADLPRVLAAELRPSEGARLERPPQVVQREPVLEPEPVGPRRQVAPRAVRSRSGAQSGSVASAGAGEASTVRTESAWTERVAAAAWTTAGVERA